MVRIYNTDTKKPIPLGKGAEHYPVRLNNDVIVWRIANEIYTDPLSGVRELMANGITAIKAAVERGLVTREQGLLSVRITADRTLEISDNGTGITADVFEQALRVMGNSTNFDGTRSGRFGMGFFAFTTLSSSAVIDTVAWDGTKFSAVCTDGRAFDVFPSTRRRERGTTITLQLYNGEAFTSPHSGARSAHPTIDIVDVLRMIRRIARMADVPVRVESERWDGALPDWIESGTATFEGRGIETMVRDVHEVDGDTGAEPTILRGSGIEVAIMYNLQASRAYLGGMPIKAEGLPVGLVVNMVDEREFEPAPNREVLTAAAANRLPGLVYGLVRPEFERLCGITDHASYRASPDKKRFRWMLANGIYYFGKRGARCRPRSVGNELNLELFASGGHSACLLDMLDDEEPAITQSVTAGTESALRRSRSRITVYTYSRANRARCEALAGKWGIPPLGVLMKERGIRAARGDPAAPSRLLVHINDHGYRTIKLGDLPSTYRLVMAEPNKWNEISGFIKNWWGLETGFVAYDKRLAGMDNVIPYPEWLDGVRSKMVDTNRGKIPASELAAHPLPRKTLRDRIPKSMWPYVKTSSYLIYFDGLTRLEEQCLMQTAGRHASYVEMGDIAKEFCGHNVGPAVLDLLAAVPAGTHQAKFDYIARGIPASRLHKKEWPAAMRAIAAIPGEPPSSDFGRVAYFMDGIHGAALPADARYELQAAIPDGLGIRTHEIPSFTGRFIRHVLDGVFKGCSVRSVGEGVYSFTGTSDGPVDLPRGLGHQAWAGRSLAFLPGMRIDPVDGGVRVSGRVELE